MKSLIISLFIFLSVSLNAWNHFAHQLIAQIAYENLDQQQQQYFDKINQLHPAIDKKFDAFSKSASWLDMLRADQFPFYDHLHYTLTPYDPEHILNNYSYRLIKSITRNNDIVWALKKSVKILESSHAKPYQKAIALKMLVHFTADIHQPLHVMSKFSNKHLFGDRGGNQFKIDSPIAPNLHKYWDSGCGLYDRLNINLDNPSSIDILRIEAQKHIKEAQSFQNEIDLNFYPDKWKKESYAFAAFVYSLPEESVIPEDYAIKGQEISKRQIVTAGLRLASILQEIYGKMQDK